MAGAGYKLFQTGDVLTAAQVNTYLNEQTVMVFANSTARTSALSGVLAEGMVSYLQDTNAVEVYDGSNWVSIGSSGDITAVTAGTGLSGGGTSGDVTLSLSTPVSATNGGTAQTTYATGDILYASASNTLTKRTIGTTGQVLTVTGGVPTWATPAGGGGKVLQVVQANYSTTVNTYSTSYADTGLTASITPSSSSSKVLVIISQGFWVGRNSTNAGLWMQLQRGSTALQTRWVQSEAAQPGGSPVAIASTTTHTYLDSPATTSSTSYKTQFKLVSADIGGWGGAANYQTESNILLLEIGA